MSTRAHLGFLAYNHAHASEPLPLKTDGSRKRRTAQGSGLGRPRGFDSREGLQKAMRVFWSLGYEATSMADLRRAVGVSQASLYAAYGNKEALFREAVELYLQTDGSGTLRALRSGLAARDAVRAMLMDAVDRFTNPELPGGCLIILSATNCTVANMKIQKHLERIRLQMCRELLLFLRRSRKTGSISSSARLTTLVGFYASVLYGLAIQSRDGASRKMLAGVVDHAMNAWPH